jgi:hypothetical protein
MVYANIMFTYKMLYGILRIQFLYKPHVKL